MFRKLLVLSGFAFLCASAALAQSSIDGVVKDSTGAVLVGVKVVASSPALIEGSRTAISAGDGRYALPNLLPATYTVTFTLQGFNTISQQVEVPQNVTVPLDATMQVGSASQTVQVTAQVATVDVENAAHPNELSRQTIDDVPSARNLQSIGSSIPSVKLNLPDVGGTQQIQQTYMAAHGNPSQNDSVYIDGLYVNTYQGDGSIQNYFDNEDFSSTTYTVGDVPVDAMGGGVDVQMVPKDGGNAFHSDIFLGWVPSAFVGNNYNPTLLARFAENPASAEVAQGKTHQLQDFDGSFGGPILKDKLWFLLAGRDQLTELLSPLGKNPDGSPGLDHSYIYTGTLRLTWQATPKNKFSASWMRMWKTVLSGYVTETGDGIPIDFDASTRRTPVMYYILQGKWSATVTPKLLFQAGYSRDNLDYNDGAQAGINQTPFTPAWFTGTTTYDPVAGVRYGPTATNYFRVDTNALMANGVYVIGAHQIKFGFDDNYGPDNTYTVLNGDGLGILESGVPTSFTVESYPQLLHDQITSMLGIYAEDIWHYKRLAITPGIRWEYMATEVHPVSTPAGRFVPARSTGLINCNTVPGLGCFKDWTPRLGLVYDVFGNHKTALKGNVSKYDIALSDSFTYLFNPQYVQSTTVGWSDPGCTGSTCVPGYPAGGTNVIGAIPTANFGLVTNRTLNPNYHREYDMQYNVGVQQQMWTHALSGLTLNFNWYHRSDYQQALVSNSAVPASAWTPTTVQNPLNGTPITLYNLQPKYFGLAPVIYKTNAPRSLRANGYTGYETSISGRLPHGAFAQFGWTIERQVDTDCDQTINNSLLNDPNSLRYCDWRGNLYQNLGAEPGIPWFNGFHAFGSIPVKYGIEMNATLYSNPIYNSNFNTNIGTTHSPMGVFSGAQDGLQGVYWSLSPGSKYPTNCQCSTPGALVDPGLAQGSETVLLVAPGAESSPRLTQLDVGVRRTFKFRDKYTAIAELQTYNILNSSVPYTYSQTLGSSITPFVPGGIGGVPTAVMNPRMFKLSGQFKF
jgi:hypothetical protein